ncbi:MAG: VWA domain-containing protein [Verrucomicrobia bacterium]|nr:VWA domain-containing protein [Verrucomicrobiota bacterium]
MNAKVFPVPSFVCVLLITAAVAGLLVSVPPRQAAAKEAEGPTTESLDQDVTQGALRVKAEDGSYVECPLKHTDVQAEISGFIARVKVRQTFYNPYNERIEAVYVFPLPHTAAVDQMTMVIGERRIVGLIKRREAARQIYEQAVAAGVTAALLEQERPNIFTQTVGNIKPHQEVDIEISYVDVLKYDMGTYEFHFPMVVGPRYIPGRPISKQPVMPPELEGKVGEAEEEGPEDGKDPKGTGWSADTDRVDDASRITPPVLKPGFRTGHDISLAVRLDAGVPIQDLKVVNHEAEVERDGNSGAAIGLSPADSIPNKDFVVKYAVVGEKPEMALLSHAAKPGDGYFMLMIQPKLDEELAKAPPRDICFLIDVSGSMSGKPTEKVKAAMREFFKLMKPEDRLQVVTFSGDSHQLFDKYVPADEEHTATALRFTEGIRGGGGTEMLKGIQMTLADPPDDPKRVRIVVMLTDGYIGNEAEIIREVGERAGDQIKFWTIGIGSSPNRFLIDGVAKTGGGMSGVLELDTDPKELVGDIMERIHRAQFANIKIDWKSLPVFDTYPAKVPELWAGRPVIVYGRYEAGGATTIELNGTIEGEPQTYKLKVTLADKEPAHDVLAKVWARQKIEDLSAQVFYGDDAALVEEVTVVALNYSLMSQYTSFVAVDESERDAFADPPKPPRRMLVPVPMPEGVSFEGVFGADAALAFDADVDEKLLFETKDAFGGSGAAGSGSRGDMVVRAQLEPKQAEMLVGAMPRRVGPGRMYSYAARSKALNAPVSPSSTLFMGSSKSMGGVRTEMLAVKSVYEARMRITTDRATIGDLASTDAATRHTEAGKAIERAEELRKAGDLDGAMAAYQQAYLLEAAFLGANPWRDDGTSLMAETALAELLDELLEARAKTLPALETKLDLVIRDLSVADALEHLAQTAGFKATIIPGSLDDARAQLDVGEPRVTYLDLRRATAGQALNWLLTPAHLAWRLDEDGGVVVGTSRRMEGASPWVYEVGALMIPVKDEVPAGAEVEDKETAAEIVKAAMDDFLKSVRLVLGQEDESGLEPGSAILLDPTRLLVYGDRPAHEHVSALLDALRDKEADVVTVVGRAISEDETAALHALQAAAAKRWAERNDVPEKRVAAQTKAETFGALDQFGWQLLAAACNGEVDDEALTELRIAWSRPECAGLIDSPAACVAMRTAWILIEASRAVPENEALRELAAEAVALAAARARDCLQALEEEPLNVNHYLGVLYARLALERAAEFGVEVADDLIERLTLVLLAQRTEGPLVPMSRLAHMLLVPKPSGLPPWPSDGPTKALEALHMSSDDLVVLAALAARRIGNSAWLSFRQDMHDVIADSYLSGHAVVVVNRLANPKLPFAVNN